MALIFMAHACWNNTKLHPRHCEAEQILMAHSYCRWCSLVKHENGAGKGARNCWCSFWDFAQDGICHREVIRRGATEAKLPHICPKLELHAWLPWLRVAGFEYMAMSGQVDEYPVSPKKQTSYFFKLLFWPWRRKWPFFKHMHQESQTIVLVLCLPTIFLSLWNIFSFHRDLDQEFQSTSRPSRAGKILSQSKSRIKHILKPPNSTDLTKAHKNLLIFPLELAHDERRSYVVFVIQVICQWCCIKHKEEWKKEKITLCIRLSNWGL